MTMMPPLFKLMGQRKDYQFQPPPVFDPYKMAKKLAPNVDPISKLSRSSVPDVEHAKAVSLVNQLALHQKAQYERMGKPKPRLSIS
jgi:hypothetical protein